ncbi:dipeptidase [Sphingosinicella rhizophila]|uniref:Membrane dipeptidase n=1 Tax=Sphingosinicella rhizophila TaxID=3050082 RepID=A0ABU3QAU2_9SPHN|nr:membrane dipeptidase [Sphingosinicella sp. GR2756]MDT9600517.1 membrane dipeptidase [Sphingosinicella sp. GR2756]
MFTPKSSLSPQTANLIREPILWDNHVCLPHRPEADWFERLEAHRSAGFTMISLNLGDAQVPFETQIRMAAHFRACIAARPDAFSLALSVADIRRAKAEGKLAIAFDVEGAWAMDGQIDLVPIYALLGVRWLLIAYNRSNAMGGGVHDDADPGLSPLGARLLDALDANGIVTCCSHTGYRTARMAIDHQAERQRTMIFSHSNVKALDDHPRNIPDTLIDAVAAVDGVIGINGISVFLGEKQDLISRYVDHVAYIADRVGPAHVGIGLDYVYDQDDMEAQLLAARDTWPEGFGYQPGNRYLAPGDLPHIVDQLLMRGWSDADVRGFLGGNFLRVAERVWK